MAPKQSPVYPPRRFLSLRLNQHQITNTANKPHTAVCQVKSSNGNKPKPIAIHNSSTLSLVASGLDFPLVRTYCCVEITNTPAKRLMPCAATITQGSTEIGK